MLSEKSIVSLCAIGLVNHCKGMLKCETVEFKEPLETFDDLQKPITVYAIYVNDEIGFKRQYTCTLTQDPTGQLLVNLTKKNSEYN